MRSGVGISVIGTSVSVSVSVRDLGLDYSQEKHDCVKVDLWTVIFQGVYMVYHLLPNSR